MTDQPSSNNQREASLILRNGALVGIGVVLVYFAYSNTQSQDDAIALPTVSQQADGRAVENEPRNQLTSSPQRDPVAFTQIDHAQAVMHTHTNLSIIINGEKQYLPANIGITEQGMRIIHTHDDSGQLHVESPYIRIYTLGDFFTIWGKKFSKDCIFEYCVDDQHTLSVVIDNAAVRTFETTPLLEGKHIQIIYAAR